LAAPALTEFVFNWVSERAGQSPADQLYLGLGDGTKVPLAGNWKAAPSVDARPPHPLPLGYEIYPIMPIVRYDGMIQPLVPLALTGALWYQGEANASRGYQFRTLLPVMIADWRRAFDQGDLPFLIVSLPACRVLGRRRRPSVALGRHEDRR
jgi:sialate O-acetylesterase